VRVGERIQIIIILPFLLTPSLQVAAYLGRGGKQLSPTLPFGVSNTPNPSLWAGEATWREG